MEMYNQWNTVPLARTQRFQSIWREFSQHDFGLSFAYVPVEQSLHLA
jgi:hypothetical protein